MHAIILFSYKQHLGMESRFRLTSSSDCICPNNTLIFECTVMTGVETVWRGSAFNCITNDTNEMILLDSDNSRLEESVSICNNGAIFGQVVEFENSNYTSQLSVTISSDMFNKSIECSTQNNTTIVGSFTIPPAPFAGT